MSPLKKLSVAALAAVMLAALAPAPAVAVPQPGKPNPGILKGHGKNDKLGSHDRELLVDAKRKNKTTVRAMFAVEPAKLAETVKAIEAAGGRVTKTEKIGYLRATVPVDKVDALSKATSVLAVDVDEEIKLSDPTPESHGSAGGTPKAPDASTPAANPYMPTNDTGAVDFAKKFDGTGVTIGILDSGVDLDHPALATTTTGERKIVDWVTATDPVSEGDGTWLAMTQQVTATPTFKAGGKTFTAPEAGTYKFSWFYEGVTAGDNEVNGDVNRDGDTWDQWGVLYRESDKAIWVDSDANGKFENAMRPYKEAQEAGHFGQMPFVVEHREVEGTPYVSIGIPAGSHGTHVAGIAAGRALFGGAMNGAAPGAKIVSSRACTWQGGCTAVALTEGMIDLVVNRGVDVVNMSIGGLPALNDGANVRTHLYNVLIDTYGVQIFVSAGNSGSGINTVGDPSVASNVVSVGASVSSETWAANYGSAVGTRMGLFNFSSRGPREDGGFKPDIVAPGAAVSSINTWLAGEAVPETGYSLPNGYAMFNGTSMASPQATGAAALLIGAARKSKVDITPAKLRTALYDGARSIPGVAAHEQGNGLIDVTKAWDLLKQKGLANGTYVFDAPVCTPISDYLTTPGRGTGLYDRCGGATEKLTKVTVTRTSGPAGDLKHSVSWSNDDFDSLGSVRLPLNKPVTIKVRQKPHGNGAHSAIMYLDNVDTPGIDARMMATVVVSNVFGSPGFQTVQSGLVRKANSETFFVTVPKDAKTLQIALDGVKDGARVRFTAQHPYGVPFETGCYTSMTTAGCNPNVRSFSDPMPGVWEVTVESARTSPSESSSYRLTASIFGVSADKTVALGTLELHKAEAVSWNVTNHFGPVSLAASSSPLGSRASQRPTIGDGQQQYFFVNVPLGTKKFQTRIGNPSDPAADLDLLVAAGGMVLGQSADGDSEESVVINDPPAGQYLVIVDGYAVPAGNTEFDYFDEIQTGTLGAVTTTFAAPLSIAQGASATVTAEVKAAGMVPNGRKLVGSLDLTTGTGAIAGQALVTIENVTGPAVHFGQSFGPMMGLAARGSVVAGSSQADAISVPTRWTEEGGMYRYSGYQGHIFSLNSKGDGVGQLEIEGGSALPVIFHADGTVTSIALPDWAGADTLYGRSFAINDSNTVVGNITSWSPETSFRNDPYLWTAADGYVKLQHLTDDPYMSEPLSINNSGLIVGSSTKDGLSVPCWWSADGKVNAITMPEGENEGVLLSVNDSGVAVGRSNSRAAIWTADGGLRHLADLGYHSEANFITADGWIIGTADAAPWEPHAVAWDPQGNLFDLNALLVEQDKFWIDGIVGIVDGGFVVYGQALDGSDANTAILHF